MPGDEERPGSADDFDPLEQPSLARRRPDPLQEEPAGAGVVRERDAAENEGAGGGPAPAAARARGRFAGFLGLIAGLAGLGLAGYLYYLLVYLDPEAGLEDRLAQVQHRLETQAQALDELKRSQARALAGLAEEQARAREAFRKEVLEAVNRISDQAPPSRREWKVAEVAYLLRIANHRLLMERDVDGALMLLNAADAILTELDDFSLYQVRARLADEILALGNVESNDLQGLFLRLEAVKTSLGRHSLKLPRMQEPAPAGAPAGAGFWDALASQISGYLRFRRFDDESLKPLLAPEEGAYLELNLRLMLERAQLAALRRDQLVYQQSLATAADWIATYMDASDAAVRRSMDELEALSAVVLDRPLPDISGSLRALESLGEA